MFGTDFIKRDTEWFAGASFHFIQTALDAAQGVHQIVRALAARFQPANIFADGILFGFMQGRLHAAKNEFAWQRCQMRTKKVSGNPFEVAERRPKIAHGETVDINAQTNKAPDGANEISVDGFSAAPFCHAVEKAEEGRRSP